MVNQLVSLTSSGSVALSNNTIPMGIVSSNPAFVGNGPNCNTKDTNCLTNFSGSHVLVSLRGQVTLDISNLNGVIQPGDPITSSNIPGVGQLATTPGYIIGYALTSPSSSNTITVLVQPGYYTPPVSTTLQGANPTLSSLTLTNGLTIGGSLNVSGNTNLTNLIVSGNELVSGTLTVQTLTVNTSLTINGLTTINGNVIINGHIITSGQTPQVSVTTNAGTNAKATIIGNDTSGSITLTTGSQTTTLDPTTNKEIVSGSNPSGGSLVNVVFSKKYGASPRVLIEANNAEAAGLQQYVNTNNSGFTLYSLNSPNPSQSLIFFYHVEQ